MINLINSDFFIIENKCGLADYFEFTKEDNHWFSKKTVLQLIPLVIKGTYIEGVEISYKK